MGYVPENTIGSFAKALEFGVDEIEPDAHQREGKVITWTINRLEDIERVLNMGVDGIISNYPDRLYGFKK
jgi:glycerophosphoryl diester phosphodiesterase